LGEGTDSLITGGYFSIPSGYPHRIKVILTYLIERGWIRFAMRLQSVMIEVVEEGMRMDTQSQKIMSITALGNAGMGARKPEMGNPMNK
jgi:hypothetical protein